MVRALFSAPVGAGESPGESCRIKLIQSLQKGVFQGAVLSPLIFIVKLQVLIDPTVMSVKKCHFLHVRLVML